MAKRYSQIKKGLEYETALNNYVDYLRNPENRRTKRMTGGTRGQRRNLTTVAVHPFGLPFEANFWVLAKVSTDGITDLRTQVNNRFSTTPADLAQASELVGFRAARLNTFRGSGAASYVQSKVTKLYYLKYEGDSASAPFGALSGAEEETTVSRAIKTAAESGGTAGSVRRASIQPERISV